ncbi:peptide transporter family 1-like [Bradysia coprophila]|uniref:peptide transporter family 1-like n=1 Tax=Bradysia coprophila TaxID=38358 RepID=UPI00187DB09E|nr:peptide transporter family 1-like [Bradysia coprophila]
MVVHDVAENGGNEVAQNIDSIRVIPYPKRVFLIIGNKFCERWSFWGLNTILVLYLKNELGYTENVTTALYHGFLTTVYFMCIFGGLLSDVWWGKFKTILNLSIMYFVGFVIMSFSSASILNISPHVLSIVGLIVIAVCAGGVQPCLSAFGADQFKSPEQEPQIVRYFSLFYFAMSLGTVLTIIISPLLKENVQCFGHDDCFPLSFGVSAISMLISIVIFVSGKSSYTCKRSSSENTVIDVFLCIWNAFLTKFRDGHAKPCKNLLDYSIDKYGHQLVEDTRILLRIFALYVPLPFFWALYDQQTSRWILQASKMNGDIGFFVVLPDQVPLLPPLLLLVFIPLFDTAIYPLLSKIGIRRPLQRMVLGGLASALAFLCSALVQFQIDRSPEKTVTMLWLVPQYVSLTVAEVMLAITGYSFSYEQAPTNMKSVVQAIWLSTRAFGDLILIFITGATFFQSLAYEFLMLSVIMAVDMIVFTGLAYNYKSNSNLK